MKNLISKVTLSVLAVSVLAQAQPVHAASRGNVAATISGVIIGGLIGASIAQNFDANDSRQAQGMWNQALSGQFNNNPYSFQGNQHRGRLIFTGEGYFDGFYCRIYRSEIWDSRSNSPMVTTGYVCRANDGSWFRKEADDIRQSRRDRPDRGQRFDPPPQQQAQQGGFDNRRGMPMNGGGGFPQQQQGFPQQQQGFPQQGRQMGGPGMGNNGPNRGFGSPGQSMGNSGGSVSSGTTTVITNGDALPLSSGVN